ncbi:hypothetical protein ACFOGG_14820 [Brenneria rubrifaciens]|uniref:hypothetical protein n=1 Tax=Brenneria rubrifaciens TaxID=55213 RepID=UPI00361E63C0
MFITFHSMPDSIRAAGASPSNRISALLQVLPWTILNFCVAKAHQKVQGTVTF